MVDDSNSDALLTRSLLAHTPDVLFHVTHALSLEDGIDLLNSESFDLVLLDLGLERTWGLETLETLLKADNSVPVVVMTGLSDQQIGVQALQRGAQDFLVKGELEANLLRRSICYSIQRHALLRDIADAATEWRNTFDSVEDMILLLDEQFRIIRANRAAESAFPDSPILGRHCYQLVHGTSHAVEHCPSCTAFAKGEVCSREMFIPNLGRRWFNFSAYPVKNPVNGTSGKISRVVHILRDITERKKSEQVARSLAAKELVLKEIEEVSDLKSRFIEVMSHEMRTPMTVIQSGVDLLIRGTLGEVPSTQKQMLGVIYRNIERLANFSTDVLSLAKLDAGRYSLQPEKLSLYETITPTLEILAVKAGEQDQRVLYPNPATTNQPDPRIFACAEALSQIMFNLVNNGITHCPRGSTITVSHRMLQDRFVEVSVSDNGPGIPQDSLNKIFRRFYQANRRPGPGYKGTGIGLSVCKALVESMGGRITAESTMGRGTRFSFTVPSIKVGDELLFGHVAVCLGLVSGEQLEKAVQIQQSTLPRKKTGEILVQLGYLDRKQVELVKASQEANLSKPHPYIPTSKGESLLGQLAMKYGFVDSDQLNDCLCFQALRNEKGQIARLGEIMIERDLVSIDDVIMLLHIQKRAIVACPQCSRQFNAKLLGQQSPERCKYCNTPLVQVNSPRSLEVDADLD